MHSSFASHTVGAHLQHAHKTADVRLNVDAIKAAAYDSSLQRWRAPPASGSAQRSTMAARSSLEQTSHTTQHSQLGAPFTPTWAYSGGSIHSSTRKAMKMKQKTQHAPLRRACEECALAARLEKAKERIVPPKLGRVTELHSLPGTVHNVMYRRVQL